MKRPERFGLDSNNLLGDLAQHHLRWSGAPKSRNLRYTLGGILVSPCGAHPSGSVASLYGSGRGSPPSASSTGREENRGRQPFTEQHLIPCGGRTGCRELRESAAHGTNRRSHGGDIRWRCNAPRYGPGGGPWSRFGELLLGGPQSCSGKRPANLQRYPTDYVPTRAASNHCRR